jgi:orotidine-5'-phosphate decarboxylase
MSLSDNAIARDRLILALDVPNIETGLALLNQVQGHIGLVKIGLELFTANGPAAVKEVRKLGFDVFLDLKLHDIPNTVAKAVLSARTLGVSMLTVHTGGGKTMLSKAAEAAGDDVKLLGVTLLTSLGAEDLEPAAILPDPAEVVRRRAVLAKESGLTGIVCSPMEIKKVRQAIGPSGIIVTPGIRPENSATGDQKRAATPSSAIGDGADYLVIGRPIHASSNPAEAAARIVDEIADALKNR